MERLAYTVRQAGQVVPMGRTKIYELIRAGTLKTVKIGRRTLITAASLQALIE